MATYWREKNDDEYSEMGDIFGKPLGGEETLLLTPVSGVLIEDKESFVQRLHGWGIPKQRAFLIWREFAGG